MMWPDDQFASIEDIERFIGVIDDQPPLPIEQRRQQVCAPDYEMLKEIERPVLQQLHMAESFVPHLASVAKRQWARLLMLAAQAAELPVYGEQEKMKRVRGSTAYALHLFRHALRLILQEIPAQGLST